MKHIRKTMALLFALVLCLGMLPGSALAKGELTKRVDKSVKTVNAINTMDSMLTFSSDAPFTLETANHLKNWNGALLFSTNAQAWTTWNGTTTLSSAAHNGQQRLYLRGTGNTWITGLTNLTKHWVLTGTDGIACTGNIENLLNYQTVAAGEHPQMADYCFQHLFHWCTSLTTAPELPATTLTDYCYSQMFSDCTSLTKAPELPATTLKDGCYAGMFYNCTSLTIAPELPSTTLASMCYLEMFKYCTSLMALPALPATDLPEDCYSFMFYGCTGIRLSEVQTNEYSVPYKIPSVEHSHNVASGALNNMFGETGGTFTGTPEADRTYYLPGPVNLSSDLALTFSDESPFTVETANHEKNWDGTLFYSTDLTDWTVWDGAETLSSDTHNGQQRLYLCGVGNTIIAGEENCRWVLTGTCGGPVPHQEEPPQRLQVNGANIACSGSIENLLNYQTVAVGVNPEMADYSFSHLFFECRDLVSAPKLPSELLAPHCYENMFAGCTALIFPPALPATVLAEECYSGMFRDCTSLRYAPALSAFTLSEGCYSYMLAGCTSLKKAPALPATTLAPRCYEGMFSDCTSLMTAPALPAEITAPHCYEKMFYNCKTLTQVPLLPAYVLEGYCYYRMFYGCSEIKLSKVQTSEYLRLYSVPALQNATYVGLNALKEMFLYTGGSFAGTPTVNTTYYLHNSNTIVL